MATFRDMIFLLKCRSLIRNNVVFPGFSSHIQMRHTLPFNHLHSFLLTLILFSISASLPTFSLLPFVVSWSLSKFLFTSLGLSFFTENIWMSQFRFSFLFFEHQISTQRPQSAEKQINIHDKEDCYKYMETLLCTMVLFEKENELCMFVHLDACCVCECALACCQPPVSCMSSGYPAVSTGCRWWDTAHTGHATREINGTHVIRKWESPFMSHTISW